MNKIYWNLVQVDTMEHPEFELSTAQWQKFSKVASEHCLQGWMWYHHSTRLPADLKKQWGIHWQSQWLRNHLYLQEWSKIQNAAGDSQLSVKALKGAALLPEIYSDLGSRQMSDLDLWVSQHQMPALEPILKNLGYAKKDTLSWKANHFKSVWTVERNSYQLVIELHTQLFSNEPTVKFWQFDTGENPRLSVTDQLVHLIGHLSYQHTFLKLFWLLDIDRWIRKHQSEINWSRVEMLCTELRMKKAMVATLWACQTYLKTPFPSEMKLQPSWIQRHFLSSQFLWRMDSFVSYYLLKVDLRDSFKDFVSYSFGWLAAEVRYFFKLRWIKPNKRIK